MIIPIALLELLFFFYTLYKLVKEDFILIRKNVNPEQAFNLAILVGIVALFFGRLGYALFHFSKKFLNPLVFITIPYYPGISLLGSIIGGTGFLLIVTKIKKLPSLRILDFFSLAALSALPIGYIGSYGLLLKRPNLSLLIAGVLYGILFFLFQFIVFPKLFRGELKEGSGSMLFLSSYAVLSFLVFLFGGNTYSLLSITYAGLLLLIFSLAVIFLWMQNFSSHPRTRR